MNTDDPLHRVVTFVQITGVLVLVAGVPRAFDAGDWTVAPSGSPRSMPGACSRPARRANAPRN
ncbi:MULTISPECIES: hypothetical protein [unclassified Streptomyces]|uniref:hypothetical protein n=1 Tax=unclassified Streptomyces TaxID=2593676 RepID=UPI002253C737|nr:MULTISPECIES: hypothetical protein [unclassified Streptomyces]